MNTSTSRLALVALLCGLSGVWTAAAARASGPEWTRSDLTVRNAAGAVVYSARRELGADLARWKAKAGGCTYTRELRPLSQLGPVLSFEQTDHNQGGGCGVLIRPDTRVSFRAITTATGRPTVLTDLFSNSAVLRALLKDKVVQQALKSAGTTSAPTSLPALWDAAAGADLPCDLTISEEMLGQFAFHHIEGDQVAVRLALPSRCLTPPDDAAKGPVQLGLLLPLPQALARRQGGSLMQQPDRTGVARPLTLRVQQ